MELDLDNFNVLPHPDYRSGIAALIGRANVGKSTLLNHILQEKVSIISPVAQTTRNVIRGIWSEERGQLVFLDTPGIHKAKYELGKVMNRTARSSMSGADLSLLILDASTRPREEDEGWMRRIIPTQTPCIIALNKCDEEASFEDDYREMWEAVSAEKGIEHVCPWFSISALTGDGVPALLDCLFTSVPIGPPLFPEEMLTDFPKKLNIADIIREKLFANLKDELPHAIAVVVDSMDETDERISIECEIYVNKPSQKGIVIGNKGRLLKKVERQARDELAGIYEKTVVLRLWVKVEKDWAKNHWILKKLGHA